MNPGTMVAIHAATVAAAAAKAQTRVLDPVRTHDATAPGRARTLAEIGLADDAAIRMLMEAGVIRAVDSRGRLTLIGDSLDRVAGYYLDEVAYVAHRDNALRARTPSGLVVVLGALLLVAVCALVVILAVNR